jgi:hypothetical protein
MKPPPFEFLFSCSKTSLQNFRLAELNKANDRTKMMRRDFEEAVEAQALALLAEWLDLYGEQLMVKESTTDETVESAAD